MFEWDARKAAANAIKHGVSFDEAATVFDRRLARTAAGRLLMVGYTRRRQGDVENIRIITARPPSRKERATYAAARD